MPRVLLATDADWIHREVDAALAGDDISVVRVSSGFEVRPVVQAGGVDLVVLDLQIGNMGGMATCMDLRLDESIGKADRVPVLMLLDRPVDSFLAGRADADGWVVKPVEPLMLLRAATALLAGDTWHPETGPEANQVVELLDDLEAEAAEAAAIAEAQAAADAERAKAEAEDAGNESDVQAISDSAQVDAPAEDQA